MRLLVMILVLAVCAGMSGCGSDGSDSNEALSGETVSVEGFDIPVKDIEEIMRTFQMSPSEAEQYLLDGIAKKKAQENQ